jgi:imidazolonepropionase
MLPCCGFHVDNRYARGGAFLDAAGLLAIATNANPGSAPSGSMPMAIALAVRALGITPTEAIGAATANAAALLGFSDRGVIGPGKRADLILLCHRDERALAYEFGADPIDAVVCGGVLVRP